MANIASVRNIECFSASRTDEAKSMGADIDVGERLRDRRHVAADAFISRAAGFVVRVFFNSFCVRPVRRIRTVAIQAQDVRGFAEQGVILSAV